MMGTTEELFQQKVEGMRDRIFAAYFGSESIEWHTTDHQHSSAQLMALTLGTASIRTESGSWVLPPGRCLYIPPDTTHSLDTDGEVRGFVLYLTSEMESVLPRRVWTFQASRLLFEVVRRLAEFSDMPNVSSYEENLARVLIDEIQRSFDLPPLMQMPLDQKLRGMASQILQFPNDKRTLEEWSYRTGMSERTLFRRFKDETGMTVGQWVQHARVHFAANQLGGGASVKQAAAAAGYDSVSSFIKSFTRIMGVTPGEHRRWRSQVENRPLSH
jgi:AraC-like DNA-binding protein/mannose-6-phosphate isomerase-like protein (cupin superfamily)